MKGCKIVTHVTLAFALPVFESFSNLLHSLGFIVGNGLHSLGILQQNGLDHSFGFIVGN